MAIGKDLVHSAFIENAREVSLTQEFGMGHTSGVSVRATHLASDLLIC
jgi:hypothetical protein